ncbi:hypothetical protein ACWGKQ_09430 [Streptomyces sp. NPDC054770]
MARQGDGDTVDEQFARLPPTAQTALEENGLGLPQLRRLASEEGGEQRVRLILSEFAPSASDPIGWWEYGGDIDGRRRGPVWPWLRLLLVAVASVALCLLSTYWINGQALFVGGALVVPVAWAAFRTRWSRGGFVACGLIGAAYLVLIWVGSYTADEWYLHLRGQVATVTYEKPENVGSHGVTTLACRVKLPDGSVRQAFSNDKWCTDEVMVGTKRTAVIDPSGHYRPFLGHKSDIGGTAAGYVCLGAAAVLVLAPLTAAVMSRANEKRGKRGGRATGTAGA